MSGPDDPESRFEMPLSWRLELPLIWFNGFPGAGKSTIAKLFMTYLGGENDTVLIDRYTLIDRVDAKISKDHPNYQEERRLAREAVFKKYVEDPAFLNRTIVIIDFQPSSDLGHQVAREYEAAALRAGREFLPVNIECDIKENIRRLMSPQRRIYGTTKLLDPETLKEIRSRHYFLYRFSTGVSISIDVTRVEAEVAAKILGEELKKLIDQVCKHQK